MTIFMIPWFAALRGEGRVGGMRSMPRRPGADDGRKAPADRGGTLWVPAVQGGTIFAINCHLRCVSYLHLRIIREGSRFLKST